MFEPSLLESYTLLLAPQLQKNGVSNDLRLRMQLAPTVILSSSGPLVQGRAFFTSRAGYILRKKHVEEACDLLEEFSAKSSKRAKDDICAAQRGGGKLPTYLRRPEIHRICREIRRWRYAVNNDAKKTTPALVRAYLEEGSQSICHAEYVGEREPHVNLRNTRDLDQRQVRRLCQRIHNFILKVHGIEVLYFEAEFCMNARKRIVLLSFFKLKIGINVIAEPFSREIMTGIGIAGQRKRELAPLATNDGGAEPQVGHGGAGAWWAPLPHELSSTTGKSAEQRTAREIVTEFYQQHNPSRVSHVDDMLARYSTTEIAANLMYKYGHSPPLLQTIPSPRVPAHRQHARTHPGMRSTAFPPTEASSLETLENEVADFFWLDAATSGDADANSNPRSIEPHDRSEPQLTPRKLVRPRTTAAKSRIHVQHCIKRPDLSSNQRQLHFRQPPALQHHCDVDGQQNMGSSHKGAVVLSMSHSSSFHAHDDDYAKVQTQAEALAREALGIYVKVGPIRGRQSRNENSARSNFAHGRDRNRAQVLCNKKNMSRTQHDLQCDHADVAEEFQDWFETQRLRQEDRPVYQLSGQRNRYIFYVTAHGSNGYWAMGDAASMMQRDGDAVWMKLVPQEAWRFAALSADTPDKVVGTWYVDVQQGGWDGMVHLPTVFVSEYDSAAASLTEKNMRTNDKFVTGPNSMPSVYMQSIPVPVDHEEQMDLALHELERYEYNVDFNLDSYRSNSQDHNVAHDARLKTLLERQLHVLNTPPAAVETAHAAVVAWAAAAEAATVYKELRRYLGSHWRVGVNAKSFMRT